MSHTLAIHWNQNQIDMALVRHTVGRSKLETVDSKPIDPAASTTEIGRHLSNMLAAHSIGRAKVVVAPGRSFFNWQHMSLPPCPAEDLPDLVQMQMMQESVATESAHDFLPLTGDENIQNHVWSIQAKPSAMAELEKICNLAELKPDRVVPLCLGYPALTHPHQDSSNNSPSISIALHPTESTLLAEAGSRIVLFRQLNLPDQSDMEALVSSLAGEVRRSLLALDQEIHSMESTAIRLIHDNLDISNKIRQRLSDSLERSVELIEIPTNIKEADINQSSQLPLVALAMQESHGKPPLVDLLNPRQRPAPPSRVRTYILAATAAACLLAFASMTGMNALQGPLKAAEAANSKTAELQPKVTYYAQAEKHAADIEAWQNNSINLLNTLEGLSMMLRPEKLDAENFPLEEDTVLERFDLSAKQLIIQGVVREDSKVLPIESKLRKRVVRVQREQSEPDSDIPEYPWGYKFLVDLTDLKPVEGESVE